VKLLNDKAVAKSQLQKKLGQLLYLTNLEKVSFVVPWSLPKWCTRSRDRNLSLFLFNTYILKKTHIL